MGEVKGFLKYPREEYKRAPVEERLKNFKEFTTLPAEKDLRKQGGRCNQGHFNP